MEAILPTSHGSITIRPSQVADAPAFRELRLEALRSAPQAFSADYTTNADQPPSFWVDRLRSMGSQGMLYFACQNEALIGMCGIQRGASPKTQHSATIWGVYVQAAYRGLGVADGLIAGCKEWARLQTIRVLKLGVITSNTSAIRCYARCGFKVYGVEPQGIEYDGVTYDELLMVQFL